MGLMMSKCTHQNKKPGAATPGFLFWAGCDYKYLSSHLQIYYEITLAATDIINDRMLSNDEYTSFLPERVTAFLLCL